MNLAPYPFLPDQAYSAEFRRPWKGLSFGMGLSWLVYGALTCHIPDWDVGISLLMGGLTYLCAPWSVGVLLNAVRYRPRGWPLQLVAALAVALGIIDGVYVGYHTLRGLPMFRWANDEASSALYFLAGTVWLYRGSLRDFFNNLAKM